MRPIILRCTQLWCHGLRILFGSRQLFECESLVKLSAVPEDHGWLGLLFFRSVHYDTMNDPGLRSVEIFFLVVFRDGYLFVITTPFIQRVEYALGRWHLRGESQLIVLVGRVLYLVRGQLELRGLLGDRVQNKQRVLLVVS